MNNTRAMPYAKTLLLATRGHATCASAPSAPCSPTRIPRSRQFVLLPSERGQRGQAAASALDCMNWRISQLHVLNRVQPPLSRERKGASTGPGSSGSRSGAALLLSSVRDPSAPHTLQHPDPAIDPEREIPAEVLWDRKGVRLWRDTRTRGAGVARLPHSASVPERRAASRPQQPAIRNDCCRVLRHRAVVCGLQCGQFGKGSARHPTACIGPADQDCVPQQPQRSPAGAQT